jgi:TPP-dependent pyruvate/acetoin dehydrogenase alpha subunit
MAKDPIDRLVATLGEHQGQLGAGELQRIEADVQASIAAAVAFAQASPVPSLESVLDDVYAP